MYWKEVLTTFVMFVKAETLLHLFQLSKIPMRRVLAILLLSLYVSYSTECFELLKIPALVEHFYDHKEENKDMSLWSFLCLHYGHGDVNDADRDEDMKLPYKSVDCNNGLTYLTLLPEINFEINLPKYQPKDKSETDFYLSRIYSSDQSSIWQPPKIA